MMIRVRKYRIFLLVAAISLTVVWFISRDAAWSDRPQLSGLTGLRDYGSLLTKEKTAPETSADDKSTTPAEQIEDEIPEPPEEPLHPNEAAAVIPLLETTGTSTSSSVASASSTSIDIDQPVVTPATTRAATLDQIPEQYHGHLQEEDFVSEPESTNVWTKSADRYPVKSLIPIPTQPPKTIPRIQYAFKPDPPTVQNELQLCRDEVRKAMQRTWNGYREFAWLKDELTPESGGYKDKFMGWAATLVDSLDTLWIMDLHREFDEAVNATATINFQQSTQSRIPMFETTIRYLGGLLGAYDISGQSRQVLLDKAVELAEVLMGAFDTPNRMPLLYYYFSDSNQPTRSQRSSCLAELGSLSVEFTRLAQLTQDARYYDAIARITDAFAEYQPKTSVPGLWPVVVDSSGCKLPERRTSAATRPVNEKIMVDKDRSSFGADSNSTISESDETRTPEEILRDGQSSSFADDTSKPAPQRPKAGSAQDFKEKFPLPSTDDVNGSKPRTPQQLSKRQLSPTATTQETDALDVEEEADLEYEEGVTDYGGLHKPEECVPVGLQSGNFGMADKYTLGGEADSTYEYLPKQYLLLGGNVDIYRQMYESAMEATKKFLLYRPMIEDSNRQLLFTGNFKPFAQIKTAESQKDGLLEPTMGHLTCFVGGMLAMGAKIFDRPEELEMAAKVTDACVWAYNATKTGVMPEDFRPMTCDDLETCPWDEDAWYAALDPAGAIREKEAQEALANPTKTENLTPLNAPMPGAPPLKPGIKFEDLEKRQLEPPEPELDDFGSSYDPPANAPLSHHEFVKARIQNEGLWPGAVSIRSRAYILRPEAIESVFYMYRITGKNEWRIKGINMWMATDKATKTKYGNSAIHDVTQFPTQLNDEMESFWPAETLKYYYLLFSDPDLVNLDDYVFNTEAHPFRRPDAQDRTKGPNRGPKAGVGSPAMQETHGIVEESHIRVAGEPGSAPKKPARKPAAAPKRLPPRS